MSPRTKRDRARRTELRLAARALERRLAAAVSEDYPALWGWAIRCPIGDRMIRTGDGADDWRWGAYRSAAQECAALQQYLTRAVDVACRRISEAYGLGTGAEFARRHGFVATDPDSTARAQTLASIARVAS